MGRRPKPPRNERGFVCSRRNKKSEQKGRAASGLWKRRMNYLGAQKKPEELRKKRVVCGDDRAGTQRQALRFNTMHHFQKKHSKSK